MPVDFQSSLASLLRSFVMVASAVQLQQPKNKRKVWNIPTVQNYCHSNLSVAVSTPPKFGGNSPLH